MQHIRHIFFDLDHTLWDFNKNSGLTFKKIFELNQLNVNLKDFLEVYEPINFKYWKLYREEKVTKSELRYSRLREAFDSVGCKVSDEMIYKLSVSYIEHLTTFSHLHDGAVDILQYLEVK
jgi:putative hydrolase of the HAD superfamily